MATTVVNVNTAGDTGNVRRHADNGAKTLNWWHKHQFLIITALSQIVFIILFGVYVQYDTNGFLSYREQQQLPAGVPVWPGGAYLTSLKMPAIPAVVASGGVLPSWTTSFSPRNQYAMFQDVHVMVFIGFGFLAAFLRRYGFSSIGLNFLLAAIAIQWATLMQGFLRWQVFDPPKKIGLSIVSLIGAEFTAVTVLVSFGAVLGRLSPTQYVVMTIIEVVLAAVNEWIGIYLLKALDVGGSIFLHTFGAYFGLAVSRMIDVRRPRSQFRGGTTSAINSSSYSSDIFCVLGTMFLWIYYPSFNAAGAGSVGEQERCIFNTYYALAACCVVTFLMSHILYGGDFSMELVQNATVAGGVAMGTTANLAVQPYGALLIGSTAAIVTVLGFCYLTPLLESKIGLRDTRGVHNLHGMPGILAAITSFIVVGSTVREQYGLYEYDVVFPAAPLGLYGLERTPGDQALYQFIALIVTLGIAIVGGIITGAILRLLPGVFVWPRDELYFDDSYTWMLPVQGDTNGGESTKRNRMVPMSVLPGESIQ